MDERSALIAALMAEDNVGREPSFHDTYIKPLGSAYPHEQPQWARDYPGLARFVGQGIPQALAGMRAPANAAMVVPPRMDPRASGMPDHGGVAATSQTLRNFAPAAMDRPGASSWPERPMGPLDPANVNAPRQSEWADPNAARFLRALTGEPPVPQIQLSPFRLIPGGKD